MNLETILLTAYLAVAAVVIVGFWAFVFATLRCLFRIFRPKKED